MAPDRNTNGNRSNSTRATAARSTAATETDTLTVQARRLTRVIDMWWAGAELVAIGKEIESASDDHLADMRENATVRQLRIFDLVDALNEWEPHFFERLNQAGTTALAIAAARDAKTRLNNGQSNGRSEDARKVREAMPKWRAWNPPLGARSERGMKHRECAVRLAPPTLDMTDEEVARKFIVDGIPAMTPECWASFMWAEGQFDRLRPSNGLLEGELMFSAATAILFSPSSSMPDTIQAAGGARGHTRRRGPIGLAKKYELTEVTPAFIAYVACVTRHALTNEHTFSEVSDGFSYTKFYYQVRGVLEAPKYVRWTKGLVERWNEKLFAGYEFGLNTATPTDQANATVNMLDAELAGMEMGPEDVGLTGSN
ncbi:hypothetical protein FRC08_002167 [Ceratobasidium sp. 394]|nr:hypothetical protein FRC08_002167 [Ceratobasidium sp. 394]KAG9086348.1 hypothetical protein FS749_003694 [Ceratobasidium sp. UAMH 11750]